MRKLMKRVLCGTILIFLIMQNASSSESIVNSMIDDDFITWSNSIPLEEAEIQLKDFLSSFDSWDEAKKWLTSKGFKVTMKSRLLIKKEREKYNNHPHVFGNSVSWNADKLGIVFANGWLHKLISKIFVYGVSVGIHYTENGKFTVYSVKVTENAL